MLVAQASICFPKASVLEVGVFHDIVFWSEGIQDLSDSRSKALTVRVPETDQHSNGTVDTVLGVDVHYLTLVTLQV